MTVSGTTLSGCGRVLLTLAIASSWFVGPRWAAAVSAVVGDDFPRALLGLASLVLLATSAWVILVVGLAQVLGSTAALRAITPHLLRTALFAGTAGALAFTPAQADRGAVAPQDHSSTRSTTHNLSGLPFPDRPTPAKPLPDQAALVDQNVEGAVIVRPGDTLWAIAQQALPAQASDADIAASSRQWYLANRAVIGRDPDLIMPAQHLRPPTKDPS